MLESHYPLLYVTGALEALALVVNPRVGGFMYILGLCRNFIWILLREWQFLLTSQPPKILTARS